MLAGLVLHVTLTYSTALRFLARVKPAAPKKIAKKMIGSMSPEAIAWTGLRGIISSRTWTRPGAWWAISTRLSPSVM
ncbi:MAG: hypothetical protein P8Y10_10910 [Gemmatimonadales bacterium]